MNGLFTYIGERPTPGVPAGSDFILLGLLNGNVYLEFNNIGGLHSLSIISTSSQLYNDGELHRLNFTFNREQFMLTVDNTDHSPPQSKTFLLQKIMALLQINTIHPLEHLVSVLIKGVFGMSSLQGYSF